MESHGFLLLKRIYLWKTSKKRLLEGAHCWATANKIASYGIKTMSFFKLMICLTMQRLLNAILGSFFITGKCDSEIQGRIRIGKSTFHKLSTTKQKTFVKDNEKSAELLYHSSPLINQERSEDNTNLVLQKNNRDTMNGLYKQRGNLTRKHTHLVSERDSLNI